MKDEPFRSGLGRGLPFRLQQAAAATPPGYVVSSASSLAFQRRPSPGPLRGVVASPAELQVESHVDKGEYAAWRHLDPERKPDKPAHIPGMQPKPEEDDGWEEEDSATPYVPGMDRYPGLKNNNNNSKNNNNINGRNYNQNFEQATDDELQTRVPNAQLVRDFRTGKKNPISALTEYCTSMRLAISFKEVAPLKKGAGIALQFANECSINGKPIRAMSGRTKKDAKTAAARATFAHLLGLTEDDLEDDDDGEGKQLVDSFGRKVTLKSAESQWKNNRKEDAASARPLREDEILPKLNFEDIGAERDLRAKDSLPHPVETLTAWSASNCRPFLFETDKLPDGLYRAFVKMEGEVAGEGFGDTAKLAQREAARFVLDKLELSPVPGADLQTKPPKVEDMIAGMFQSKHQEIIFDIVKAAADSGIQFDVDSLTEVPAAGFILHRGQYSNYAEIVSLG